MILASHGLIASQIASFDADAAAFFARVTAAGGTLSATEKNATNQLVLDLKANSLWTPMKAIYPMVGASAAACAQNLKSSSFTGTFTSGWTFDNGGITPNGTSAYMDTNLNALSNLSTDSTHISQYFPNLQFEISSQIGAYGDGTGTFAFWKYDASVKIYMRLSANNNTFVNGTINAQSGFNLAVRTSSSFSKIYVNNSSFETSTNSSFGQANLNFYIGARNNSGVPFNFSTTKQSFCTIGDGLTDTQASNFYTAVQAFQTTLNRNV
jgi:hypothetical protein